MQGTVESSANKTKRSSVNNFQMDETTKDFNEGVVEISKAKIRNKRLSD